jgi:hypothetical protein
VAPYCKWRIAEPLEVEKGVKGHRGKIVAKNNKHDGGEDGRTK